MSNETKWMDLSKEIESLVKKAEESHESVQALQFSQAASNAANAMACVNNDIHAQQQAARIAAGLNAAETKHDMP